MPQLTDPDYKDRKVIREADLRRHLLAQAKVEDKLLETDDTPDPRFTAKAEDLKKQGIKDFQLYYALNTMKRLAVARRRSHRPRRRRSRARPDERGGRGDRPAAVSRSAPAAAARLIALLLAARAARRRARLAISRRPSPVRDVLLAALAARRRDRARRARVHRAGGVAALAHSGAARGAGDRGFRARSASITPASKRRFSRASPSAPRLAKGAQHGGPAQADHPRAAGPLRRGPVPLPRHLDGRMERDPFARRGGADPAPEPQGRGARDRLAPGDRRADTRLDAARRPGRRIWRDAHLRRPARRASPQLSRRPS